MSLQATCGTMTAKGMCQPREHGAPAPARVHMVDVGPIDSIPLGQGRAYVLLGRTIAIFRQRDGQLYGVDNVCPHRGGPLAEGVLGNGIVICPLHGWKVDLASGRCLGEDAALTTYHCALRGGRIVVEVPE